MKWILGVKSGMVQGKGKKEEDLKELEYGGRWKEK